MYGAGVFTASKSRFVFCFFNSFYFLHWENANLDNSFCSLTLNALKSFLSTVTFLHCTRVAGCWRVCRKVTLGTKKKKKAEFRLWFWKNTEKKTQQVLSCVIHISNWDMSVSWSANLFHRLKYVSHCWMCWTDIQGSPTAPLTLVISRLFLSLTSTFAIGSEMSRKFILSHKCLQHSETENFTVFEKDSYCFPYRVIHQECVCV